MCTSGISTGVKEHLSLTQMGLLLDLTPDGGMDDVGNDEDLEAELLNLVGGGGGRAQGKKEQGRGEVGGAFGLWSLGLLLPDLMSVFMSSSCSNG